MSEKVLKTCRDCGGEFLGDPRALYCKDCRTRRIVAGKQGKEPPTIKSGWRHMFRDSTGTVIRDGANVMDALDDLCAYEEACEAAGIHGPAELRKRLQQAEEDRTAAEKARLEAQPEPEQPQPEPARRPRWTTGKHCEGCAFYRATVPSGGHGICKIHKRRVRPQGGKGQNYVLLDEPRQVMARRVACGDWRDKNSREPPLWVGPSAELLREEIGKENADGTRKT